MASTHWHEDREDQLPLYQNEDEMDWLMGYNGADASAHLNLRLSFRNGSPEANVIRFICSKVPSNTQERANLVLVLAKVQVDDCVKANCSRLVTIATVRHQDLIVRLFAPLRTDRPGEARCTDPSPTKWSMFAFSFLGSRQVNMLKQEKLWFSGMY